LKKVKEKILENHLNTCVTTAIKEEDEKERKRVINELLEVYKKICWKKEKTVAKEKRDKRNKG